MVVVVVVVHLFISAGCYYGATNSKDPLGTSLVD
jgi:hypothetical protein